MWSIYQMIMSFNPSAKEFQHVLTLSVMCNVSKTLWPQMRACVKAARSIPATVDAGKRNFKWPLFIVNSVHRHQRLLTCMKLCIFSSLMCWPLVLVPQRRPFYYVHMDVEILGMPVLFVPWLKEAFGEEWNWIALCSSVLMHGSALDGPSWRGWEWGWWVFLGIEASTMLCLLPCSCRCQSPLC